MTTPNMVHSSAILKRTRELRVFRARKRATGVKKMFWVEYLALSSSSLHSGTDYLGQNVVLNILLDVRLHTKIIQTHDIQDSCWRKINQMDKVVVGMIRHPTVDRVFSWILYDIDV